MLFNSYAFLVFFPVVVLVYMVCPRKKRYLWLLAASYFFYMGWNPVYALLIAASTAITYLSGRLLARIAALPDGEITPARRAALKKYCVAGSFVLNLGILFFFKYFYFTLDNVNAVLGLLHIAPLITTLDVVLPVGISFYTFQALSYTVDVYRGEIAAEKNFFRYALFVSFFPQLVAGPIERSKNLLTQVDRVEQLELWNYDRIVNGLILMLWGFFQKMVIADKAALFVNTVFDQYWAHGTVELVLAAAGFAVQIYCDFGSYSAIAIGAAQVMGFTLMENFDTPYFAVSIRDFWRRWHISLSTWFRDYLYIPLGGSRKGKARKYFNIMLTFLCSGLWHGASWSFVVWGGLHGAYQVAADLIAPGKKRLNAALHTRTESLGYKLGQVFVTFVLVDIAWIFFRSATLRDALLYLYALFTRWNPGMLFSDELYTFGLSHPQAMVLMFSLAALLLVDLVKYCRHERIDEFLSKQTLPFRWAVLFGLVLFIYLFGQYGPAVDPQAFIYFQF